MAIYDDNPPFVFLFFQSEWDDYGTMGIGDADGWPFRTVEYLSFDNYGERPLGDSLRRELNEIIPDEKQRHDVIRVILRWLENNSEGVSNFDELCETFEITDKKVQTVAEELAEKLAKALEDTRDLALQVPALQPGGWEGEVIEAANTILAEFEAAKEEATNNGTK